MKLIDFIGQEDVLSDLVIHISHSLLSYTPLEHSIFFGPPGTGKTTIAEAISKELNTVLYQQTGQELNHDYLKKVYKSIRYRDIIFIDEIHNVPIKTMEMLYGPLQIINNMKLDRDDSEIFYHEGCSISPFTLIGATTSAGMIAKPLRDRIILSYSFHLYSIKELSAILQRKECPKESANEIASRSRGTPRIALNYFLRIRNESFGAENIKTEICLKMFERQGIDKIGLTHNDYSILTHLLENGSTSESELHRTLGMDVYDYQNIYEPYLLNQKLIKITSRGRDLTKKGESYASKIKTLY